jgi:hypothetical protein
MLRDIPEHCPGNRVCAAILPPVAEKTLPRLCSQLTSVLTVALVTGFAVHAARAAPLRTVPCNEAILASEFPNNNAGYRTVLGVLSVPAAYQAQIVRSGKPRWRYWRKAGLVVLSTLPVDVTVPRAWQSRLAITWGNRPGIFSSLRIAGCEPLAGDQPARAYAGGFYLKSPSACAPLVFSVGGRSETVRFGLGRRCS